MKYLDLLEELSNQTADVYTLKRLEEVFKENKPVVKNKTQKLYDVMTTLKHFSALSWRRIERRIQNEDGLKEEAFIRFCQFHTICRQTNLVEQMLGVCSASDRNKVLQEKLQKSLKNSQKLFDRIPHELRIYEESFLADVRILRPQIFTSRIIYHPGFFMPPRRDMKDFIRSKDTSKRVVELDDLIPHAFYYGDNIKRCASIGGLMKNNKKIEELGLENDF